jgi:2',3'-cyclic-nucleotide 2'-phosphodiesterase (5'-nucleotidase family)
MKLFRGVPGRLLLGLALFTLVLPTLSIAAEYKLTLIHTNDHHGHFMKFGLDVGGLAAQSTLINVVRARVTGAKDAPGYVILLSAGDINTGVYRPTLIESFDLPISIKSVYSTQKSTGRQRGFH